MQSSSQIITTNKPTPSFLQAGCPSCRRTNSVKALMGKISHSMDLLTLKLTFGLPTLSLTTNSSWLPWGRVAMPDGWWFLVKSFPLGANPLTAISTVVRVFYMPNYPTLVFYIWDELLHWLHSYCWETMYQSFTPNFSVHPVGKTMHWIEKWLLLFQWSQHPLSPCKVWGRSINAWRL